jgi:hypothetical protein
LSLAPTPTLIRSGFTNGTYNVIRNNIITNCFSSNGQHIIGIDVTGESSNLLISGNIVNLNSMVSSPLDDQNSIYSALFVGEHLKFVEIDSNNTFKQKQTILHAARIRRRNVRQLSINNIKQQNDKRNSMSNEIENNHNHHATKNRAFTIQSHDSGTTKMSTESSASSSSSRSLNKIKNRGGCPMFQNILQ